MIEGDLLARALGVFLQIAIPIALAVLAGAAVGAVIRAAFQIDDNVVTYLCKFSAAILVLYVSAGRVGSALFELTTRLWGGSEFY